MKHSAVVCSVCILALAFWAVGLTAANPPSAGAQRLPEVQREIDDVKSSSRAAQQQYFKLLEKRLDRANRVFMSLAEADAAQSETAQLLRRKTLTWDYLESLIERTVLAEKRAKTVTEDKRRPVPPPQASQGSDEVKINFDDLRVRVAGVNMELRALEAELDDAKSGTIDGLESMMDRLESSLSKRNDLSLYVNLVEESQRKSLRLYSPRVLVSQFSRKIFETRTKTQNDSPANESSKEKLLQRLDDLSRRLAAATA